MQTRVPPQAYIDQEWFERERDLLFKPLWQFIAPRTMLDKPNAFITRNLFGMPIVVQNMKGELRAFENVCPHRQNPIQLQPHGVRPLFCGYHGWSFGQDGAPTNIPFEDSIYRFTPQEKECLHLRRFAISCSSTCHRSRCRSKSSSAPATSPIWRALRKHSTAR
jgi:phenylpropionate dioxygenase-like ring-hydroxylating dioxygenase large terminal subunit